MPPPVFNMTRAEYMEKCGTCRHYKPTTIFDLCAEGSSEYTAQGGKDFHTCGHMRTVGACGNESRLWRPA